MNTNLLVSITLEELKELIKSAVQEALNEIYSINLADQDKSTIFHTREQAKEILHTTYPTLQKYTDSGLLKATYFGRKVLYRDEDIKKALPTIRTIQAKYRRRK